MGVGQEAQDTAMFRELEGRLPQPDVRSSTEEIAKLLADEFTEFGSSGLVFNKHHIIEALRDEHAEELSPARTADDLTV
jgi:hypothetical protein